MEMLHVRLKSDIHKAFKAHCAINGLTITSVIGDLIQRYLLENKGN